MRAGVIHNELLPSIINPQPWSIASRVRQGSGGTTRLDVSCFLMSEMSAEVGGAYVQLSVRGESFPLEGFLPLLTDVSWGSNVGRVRLGRGGVGGAM